MNIEVEIKVRLENYEEVRKKVAEIGHLVKSIRQIDEYFVPKHRDFFERKPHPVEWLRLRTNPDKIVFEYDISINPKEDGDHDYAEEYETGIENPEEFKKILKFLDFFIKTIIDKSREYWQCGKIEVALDTVKDLGTFIEAEAKGDFKDAKEAKEACLKFLESLGIKNLKENIVTTGYPELLLKTRNK